MGSWAGMAAAAALLAAGSAQAQGDRDFERGFCRDLERVLDAAPDFDTLERSRAAPPRFGFRHGCQAIAAGDTAPAAWHCHQNLAPEHLSLESLATRTAACLPQAVRTKGRWGRQAIFTLPGARILIRESGGPRAKVGRIVGYRVEAAGALAD